MDSPTDSHLADFSAVYLLCDLTDTPDKIDNRQKVTSSYLYAFTHFQPVTCIMQPVTYQPIFKTFAPRIFLFFSSINATFASSSLYS